VGQVRIQKFDLQKNASPFKFYSGGGANTAEILKSNFNGVKGRILDFGKKTTGGLQLLSASSAARCALAAFFRRNYTFHNGAIGNHSPFAQGHPPAAAD
jgi:hypothetical protein